jgi:hypothetical protein
MPNMERSRLGLIGCALLALAFLGGCSDDGSGTMGDAEPVKPDGGDSGGRNNDSNDGPEPNNTGNNTGNNNSNNNSSTNNNGPEPDSGPANGGEVDSGDSTGGPCEPKGCDDVGAVCGLIDPGCGLPMLDCDPQGTACTFPQSCQGNQCGCTPKTCATAGPDGGPAECGQNIADGCGGTIASCGDCSDQSGANWMCGTNSNKCECAPSTCGARVCGTIPDGCGMMTLTCGPSAGACDSPAKKCDAAGGCVCKTNAEYATTACGAQTCGNVTVGGCTFSCGAPCMTTCGPTENCTTGCNCPAGPPAQQCGVTSKLCCVESTEAALCAGKGCGTTVTDPCSGKTTVCGCAAGQACVDKTYIEGATANQCLETNLANLLGGYVVRTHAFSNAGGVLGINRSESVSKVSVRKRSNNTLEMVDEGCVATSINSGGNTTSVAPAYFNIPAVRTPITQTGAAWERPFQTTPVALGFVPQLPGSPAYCTGTTPTPNAAAPDFDTIPTDLDTTPTRSSGADKEWLTPACTCPLTAATCTATDLAATGTGPAVDKAEACLPAENTGAATAATDCRINDIDKDGQPGFTAIATALGQTLTTGAATAANIKWNGSLIAQPHHAAVALDPQPTFRRIVYCTGGGGLVTCAGAGDATNTSCNSKFNRVQFHKLTPTDFSALTCGKFYSVDIANGAKVTSLSQVNTAAINQYFGNQYACSATSPCPDGLLCQTGQCVPKTSPGACANGVSCGDGWTCNASRGNTCWPTGTCQ